MRGSWPALAALLVVLLAGCGKSDQEAYCEVVQEQQKPLTEAVAGGGPTALLAALPIFRTLRDAAPTDIVDDWGVVVQRITALETALDDAGVDPASFDEATAGDGVSPEELASITAAANGLSAPATVAALNSVQQQARDVCKTPLSVG